MITVSDDLMNVLRFGSYRYRARCFTTLDGRLLADNLPIISGQEEYDESLSVPERVTIAVPRMIDGVSYEPTSPASALAAYGQRLHVQLGVDVGAYGTEWFNRGEFLITESKANGDQVDVTAAGLLEIIDEARFITPYSPAGTIAGVLRNLVEPALPLLIDTALVDRATPGASAGINYDEDRLAAFWEVLDAWPADARIMPEGYLYVFPESVGTRDWNLFSTNRTDSPFDQATIVRNQGSSSRDGVYNVVVARGQTSDGGQVYAAAFDTSGSASRYGGPFNKFPVPYFYSSPFLTDRPACLAAAQKILRRKQRATFASYDVTCVPVPILTGRDGVWVIDGTEDIDQATTPTVVEALTLPYTANGGEMKLKLRGKIPQ
jgi:uncharacterized protein DUF5047